MKPRVEIRLKPEALTFEAWSGERHEAYTLPLREKQAPLISALVQCTLSCEPLPERWNLIIVAGELVIEGAGHRQSFALGSREADTRLELAALVAACSPNGESLLERIAAVQRIDSRL